MEKAEDRGRKSEVRSRISDRGSPTSVFQPRWVFLYIGTLLLTGVLAALAVGWLIEFGMRSAE